MEQLFLLFSGLILLAGLMVITSLNPIHSVFWLTLTFILAASLFITIQVNFVALMLIIVYVGAIAILFLFVIMMIDILKFREFVDLSHLLPMTLILGLSFFLNLWLLHRQQLFDFNSQGQNAEWGFIDSTNLAQIGELLYTDYGLPFIGASLILLIAMVGAIVLTHDLAKETKRQSLSFQHQRNNSWI
uniref:NADH-ubiquinone oxidoreductase chain 6 n=1 Tax=Cubaia aphrodite TaxID=1104540 RepID=G9ISN5_CUBAP|nr:NADH dehydrogenase subunit 6 [Cubaia aphrodite]AER54534.1 NADH dehydrogenase subunit 6 [Cubaia aphrodite]